MTDFALFIVSRLMQAWTDCLHLKSHKTVFAVHMLSVLSFQHTTPQIFLYNNYNMYTQI